MSVLADVSRVSHVGVPLMGHRNLANQYRNGAVSQVSYLFSNIQGVKIYIERDVADLNGPHGTRRRK
jgi:hypothetical protein